MRLRCCESALWIPVFLGVTRHGKYSAVYELLADKYNADIQKGWLCGIDLIPLLRSPAGSAKKLLKTTRQLDDPTPRRRLMIRIKFLGDGSRTGDGWLSSGALAATGRRVRRVDAGTFLQIGGPCITQHDKKNF